MADSTPAQNTTPTAAVLTELNPLVAADFGPEASDLFLAQSPTENEATTVHIALDQLKDRYAEKAKPDSFFPTPAQVLLYARTYAPETLTDGDFESADRLMKSLISVTKAHSKHCEATNQSKPTIGSALEYAVQIHETGTLARFNEGELYNATPMTRLKYVLSLDEVTAPGSLLDSEPEGAPLTQATTPADAAEPVDNAHALALLSNIPKHELSVLPIRSSDLADLVARHNLSEGDIHDLIHIQKTDGSSATAMALLQAGKTMGFVRVVTDVQSLVHGTFGDINLPEMMQLSRLEATEAEAIKRSRSALDIESLEKLMEHFHLTEPQEIAEALETIQTQLKPLIDRRGRMTMVGLIDEIIETSIAQPEGVRGYWDRIVDLITND